MADRTLVLSWTQSVRGREERALELFNESVGLYGRMQQEGRIESFDVTLLRPNATMDGFMSIRGTSAQIDALQEDPEFMRVLVEAQLCVDGIATTEGFTGEGIAEVMGIYQEALTKIPQTT